MPQDSTPAAPVRRRRLVICADGTWNTTDSEEREPPPTNVVKIARAVAPYAADGTVQIAFYHEGVGNEQGWRRMLSGVTGAGLSRNVRACYRFLVDNYAPGDELYFFGFSRGAYTVRSLTGMIRNSGLLRSEHAHLIPRAYALYRDRTDATHPNSVEAQTFRAQHAHPDVRVHFVGVWDSVGALGLPTWGPIGRRLARKYGFHDVALSSIVDHAYHALAIDERRKPFLPAVWDVDTPLQDVEQMWFAGVHSNVGGGYADCGLSDIALLWMIEKAAACGLAIDNGYISAVARPSVRGRLYESMSPVYRVLHPFLAPTDEDGRRIIKRPRPPRAGKPVRTCERVHATVYERMRTVLDGEPPYSPRNLPPDTPPPPAHHLADAPFVPFPVRPTRDPAAAATTVDVPPPAMMQAPPNPIARPTTMPPPS